METKIPQITSFSIKGLFGTHDVHIPFNEEAKILIGENGIGKTQVLNIFYYTLTRNYRKLVELPFDEVVLEVKGKEISLEKKYVERHAIPSMEEFRRRELYELYKLVGLSNYNYIKRASSRLYRHGEFLDFFKREFSHLKFDNYSINDLKYAFKDEAERALEDYDVSEFDESTIPQELEAFEKGLAYLIGSNILYFPTYRRVEEDLRSLGYEEEKFERYEENNKLIHFGMDDVKKRFSEIETQIERLSQQGLTKISSEILSKLVSGFDNVDESIIKKIDEQNIDIILSRAGKQISDENKVQIRELVKGEGNSTEKSLLYFLQVLIEIYEKQKKYDTAIKKFIDVCNGYLEGKAFVYDESEIKISIVSKLTNQKIQLRKLSSGEKQIISIFSKVYLSKEEEGNFMVLFDEPELSLSMPWQKKLLPDIMKSGRCSFLMAVTHSPFIFDNELDKHAVGLHEYISPAEGLQIQK